MKKRILSLVLTMAMLLGAFPAVLASAATYELNDNVEDGIYLYKEATPHLVNGVPDGTVDIAINAYTTGTVSTQQTTTPTDIVLVIDVSGSMDDSQTLGAVYTPVYGDVVSTDGNSSYGFPMTGPDYYVKNSAGEWVEVTRRWQDGNGFVYYRYGSIGNRTNVYPAMADGSVPAGVTRSNNYDVVQFYTKDASNEVTEKKLATMKNAVSSFIDETMALNQGVSGSHIHRIAIVKYATNAFYNANNAVAAVANVGNNVDSDGYNYTQLIADFTRVDAAGASALKSAVNSLTAGGATAVDYGVELAEATLNARPTSEISAHNEVVVVFTDGVPTHSNSYNASVAGAAINHANALKDVDTTIYTLSVADNSDAGSLGTDSANQFMHYLSSNYPESSYSNGTISAGTGSPSNGYYMTPTSGIDLSGLFENIAQSIGSPAISLGQNAAVVDTLSPYFNFSTPDPINSVKVETRDKLTSGFSALSPLAGASVTVDSANKLLTVTGFNFDENYVSSTPRDGGFLGRMLVITINVTPDYNVIDGMDPKQGELETNLASNPLMIIDDAGNIAAQTASPTITLNKITYEVDGVEYDTFYRLPGGEHTLITTPSRAGNTFHGWSSSDATIVGGKITMPSSDVLITGTFTANQYNVAYQYENGVPAGAPAAPAAQDYTYGTTVTVEPDPAAPAGYHFSGWTTSTVDASSGSFQMPAHNVLFKGYFIANGNTAYKIEHYKQQLDGTYTQTPDESYSEYGTTGANVSASYLTFDGFSPDTAYAETKLSGFIAGDGSLVLKLFYKRNTYNVTYEYTGTVPTGATTLPAGGTYKFGETVTVAPLATAAGYEFHGWISDTVAASAGSFTMPAHDVIIHGHFVASGDTPYKVEHYLQNLDGTYPDTSNQTDLHKGTTNESVEALPKSFEGFTYDVVTTGEQYKGIIAADGSLVLKLYYSRAIYTVTYGYIGTVPASAPALPATATYKFGETVTVAPDAILAGYDFHGWRSIGGTVTETDVSFAMPAQNVILRGQFTVRNDVVYKVEHYVQQMGYSDITNPASYKLYTTTTHNDGVSDQPVTALPIYIMGYETDTANASGLNVKTGIVKGDGTLVLQLYYLRHEHKVTYEYAGTIPAGAPTVPATENYVEGEGVTVATLTGIPAGYTFSGFTGRNVTVTGGTFTMPDRDVVLVGHFIPDDTTYKVEHYLQNLAGDGYDLQTADTKILPAKVGDLAVAVANTYPGFQIKVTNDYDGIVLPGGALTIKLYYDRLSYPVTYKYYGIQPEGAPDIPADYNGHTYKYGETVTVRDVMTWTGYTFNGWYSSQVMLNGSFTMPATAVELVGTFVASSNTAYKTEHYLQQADGTYSLTETEPGVGETGTKVDAVAKTYTGYTFNPDHADTVKSGTIKADGSLVLKLYYDANGDTPYKVEHYIEKDDGTFELKETENLTGTTGATVNGNAKTYDGYTFDEDNALNVLSGVVLANGSLTLKLHYTKNPPAQFKITYFVDGVQYHTVTLAAGSEHTVIAAPSKAGYTFSGWSQPYNTVTKAYFAAASGKFTMPAADVEIYGSFSAIATTGHIEILKTVNAPFNFKGDTKGFTFDIYREVNGNKVYVQSIYVPTNIKVKIELPAGVYYIYEDADRVEGFALYTTCTNKDNKVVLGAGETKPVGFTNTYIFLELEKKDHFGYIVGYPDGYVHPERNITRAEVATIFFRMMTDATRNYYMSTTNTFTDVNRGAWYNRAISTLQSAGVLNGYADGTFRPNEYITRAEFTKIAVSFYGTYAGRNSAFADVTAHWSEKFVNAAYDYGFVDGYPGGTFKPNQLITRAEAMKIVNRTLDRAPHKDGLLPNMIIWPDNLNRNTWYYAEVQEATNSHDYIMKNGYEVWKSILPMRDWAALEKDD